MPQYLVAARYATPRGREGSRTVLITQPTIGAAMAEMTRRLQNAGCSKIDLTITEKEPT